MKVKIIGGFKLTSGERTRQIKYRKRVSDTHMCKIDRRLDNHVTNLDEVKSCSRLKRKPLIFHISVEAVSTEEAFSTN